jgi:hypothetical protein
MGLTDASRTHATTAYRRGLNTLTTSITYSRSVPFNAQGETDAALKHFQAAIVSLRNFWLTADFACNNASRSMPVIAPNT